VREPLINFLVAEATILDRERIDRRHENPLRRLRLLFVFGTADNDRIVLVDPTPQIFPHLGVWPREIQVTTPDPRAFLFVVFNQRQRLRIVHDHEIVLEKIAHAVLINYLLENFLFDAGEIDFSALERVMHFFCDREKIGSSLDHSPLGAQAEAVHKQRERGNHLRHAAAVVSRIEIRDAQPL
jgi:hypothetical protein